MSSSVVSWLRAKPCRRGQSSSEKGKPDAGVECYWTLPTTEEIAWQAKYFLRLDTTLWAQLDESVKTALDKHPKLIRYYVCVPVDLPDDRVGKQKSALQKWQERVAKWDGWAKTKGMSVEFVWWGSHEMLDKLAPRANAGLTRFWFEAAILDPLWFEDPLKDAIAAAGPRYTPDVNVELPIVQELEAFGRTSAWLHRLKKFASWVSKFKGTATHDVDKLGTLQAEVEKALVLVDAGIVMLRDITVDPTAPVSFSPLLSQIQATQTAIRTLYPKLTEAARLDDQNPSAQTTDRGHRGNPFRSIRYRLYDVDQVLTETAGTLSHTGKLAESTLLLLNGIAGMGKTHLLCDLAMKRQKAGLPTVLVMGQRFRQHTEPWTQVLQQLHMAQWSAEEFVGALEAVAQSVNARLLVMIDALNEGAGREIWPDHMSAFLLLIARSPWIGVVVRVRSSYEELVLPQSIIKSASRVTHGGFADHEYDASKTFFKFYGIELPSTPLLAPGYRSPLFLKSICEGLKEAGQNACHGDSTGFPKCFGCIRMRSIAVWRKQLLGLDGRLSSEILGAIQVPDNAMPDVVAAGTDLGEVAGSVAEIHGLAGCRLITPACHYTASAIAAIPDTGQDWAYISSGTWSLVGTRLTSPVNSPEAQAANFTNLAGVDGSVCFHKSGNGMWLIRQCLEY